MDGGADVPDLNMSGSSETPVLEVSGSSDTPVLVGFADANVVSLDIREQLDEICLDRPGRLRPHHLNIPRNPEGGLGRDADVSLSKDDRVLSGAIEEPMVGMSARLESLESPCTKRPVGSEDMLGSDSASK